MGGGTLARRGRDGGGQVLDLVDLGIARAPQRADADGVDGQVAEIVNIHRRIIGVVDLGLLVVGGQAHQEALLVGRPARRDELGLLIAPQGEDVIDLEVVVDGQPQLLQVVDAL